MNNYNLSHN